MSDDRVGKLLERVAREMTEQIRVNGTVFLSGGLESWNPPSPGKVAELSAKLLEARLGPLLRAGQAMRPWLVFCDESNASGKAWDAALAALESRDGK